MHRYLHTYMRTSMPTHSNVYTYAHYTYMHIYISCTRAQLMHISLSPYCVLPHFVMQTYIERERERQTAMHTRVYRTHMHVYTETESQ